MIRRLSWSLVLLVPACGGGGGGTVTPVGAPVRLSAAPLELGPATTETELVVSLPADGGEAPVLLRVAIDLPPALALAANDRVLPAASVTTLDSEQQGSRLVVICGDAQNPVAPPLTPGPLFRVRLVAATPRQIGSHQIRLSEVQAATSDGARLAVESAPTLVPVTLR